jgi:hypothetical protein
LFAVAVRASLCEDNTLAHMSVKLCPCERADLLARRRSMGC